MVGRHASVRSICKSQQSIPTCGTDEFLSYENGNYVCRGITRPACGPDEVLTADGTGFYCVKRTDDIPACAAGQFLTYNGAAYQCATTQQVPTCGTDQALTGSGGQFVCVDIGGSGSGSGGAPVSVTPDTDYTAPSDGTVFVTAGADPSARSPIFRLLVDGAVIAHLYAQDSYVSGVPSIGVNNLTYPVRKGQTVRLTTVSPAAAVVMTFIPR
jgi:hypothetical protein